MIVIVGAGPGGLAAGAALYRAGFPVLILERAEALHTVGAGLLAGANALRMLASVGLADRVRAAGQVIRTARVERFDGRCLTQADFSDFEERFGQPSVAIHRMDLSSVLASALPPGALRFGAQVTGFSQNEDRVIVKLEGGETIAADLLVAGDGIASVIREQLIGPVELRYAGYTCWRGVVEGVPGLEPATMVERWGPGRRFGIVPLGQDRTYFFATESTSARGEDGSEPLSELQARFQSFAAPVEAVLSASRSGVLHRADVLEIPALPTWTENRVALMGDAAHAMTPNLGQGACQAIEDAVVLSACLARWRSDLPAGLEAYASARRPRATAVADKSRHLGEVAQWKHPWARFVRDMFLSWTPPAVVARGLESTLAVPVPESGPVLAS